MTDPILATPADDNVPVPAPIPIKPELALKAAKAGIRLGPSDEMTRHVDEYGLQFRQKAWANIIGSGETQRSIDELLYSRIGESHRQLMLVKSMAEMLNAPEAVSPGKMTWETLKYSAESFGRGVLAIPAAAGGVVTKVTGGEYEGSLLDSLAGWAEDRYHKHADVMSDLSQRHYATGGGRIALIAESIFGQAPEILATGFGASVIARAAAAKLAGTAAGGVIAADAASVVRSPLAVWKESIAAQRGLTGTALEAQKTSFAFKGSAFLQGGIEGSRNLIDRAQSNYAEGKEMVTMEDVAASVAVAALVNYTEIIGRLTGEMRMLSAGSKETPWGSFGRDIATQPLQEAVQEAGQHIINDIADGKAVDWSEVGWSAFAGALGGTFFTAPSFIRAMTSHLPADQQAVEAKRMDTLARVTQAPVVEKVAQLTGQMVQQMRQVQTNAKDLDLDQLRDVASLVVTEEVDNYRWNEDNFAEVAQSAGMSVAELTAAMGARNEAGTIEATARDTIAFMAVAKDDLVSNLIMHQRNNPTQMSLAEINDFIKMIKKEVSEGGPKLPDDTKDDSDEIEAALTAEIREAAGQAGAKAITARISEASAVIAAAFYRTNAIAWNAGQADAGRSKRVTPKQLWEMDRARFKKAQEQKAEGLEQPGEEIRGTYDPVSKMIELGKQADASTVLHEMMHHWVESIRGWSKDPEAPLVFKKYIDDLGDWAAKNADQVAAHYNRGLRKKRPSDPDPIRVTDSQVREAAADMQNLDWRTPQGAAVHEGITGAYEEYMAKGKAPSLRLARVFESFTKWFKDIYSILLRGRNSTGTTLLTDDTKKIFDSLFAAHDEVLPPTFAVLDGSKIGMDEEAMARLAEATAATVGAARAEVFQRIRDRLQKTRMMEEKAATEAVRADLVAVPVHNAQMQMGDKKLDRVEAKTMLAAKPELLASLEKAGLLADGGMSITALANDTQYATDEVGKMLEELAAAPSLESAIKTRVDAMMAPPLTESEINAYIMEDAENRAAIAAAEFAAVKQVLPAVKKEAKARLVEVEKANKQLEAAQKKAADLVERIKLSEDADAAGYDSLVRELDQDLNLEEAIAYRVQEARERDKSDSELRKMFSDREAAASEKALKAAAKKEFQKAFDAHVESRVMKGALALLNNEIAAEKKGQVAEKKATSRALLKNSKAELLSVQYAVRDAFSKIPVREIRPSKYKRAAESARRRREQALADQNVKSVQKLTRDIMLAEAMHAEAIRARVAADQVMSEVHDRMSVEFTKRLSVAGTPGIVDTQTGAFIQKVSLAEANKDIRGMDQRRYRVTSSDDLSEQQLAIKAMFAKIPNFTRLEEDYQKHPTNYTQPMLQLFGFKKHPMLWNMDDWMTVRKQLEYMEWTADNRLSVEKQANADIAAALTSIRASAPVSATPIPSLTGHAVRSTVRWLWESNLNPVTLLRTKNITGPMLDLFITDARNAEIKMHTLMGQAQTIIRPSLAAFTKVEQTAMSQAISFNGVKLKRTEQLTQLMMFGSPSGQQRAREDMKLRFIKYAGMNEAEALRSSEAYFANLLDNVSAKEVALIESYWAANEHVWGFQVATAKASGLPRPDDLEIRPFSVKVDGKETVLKGGYAAIPYETQDISLALMTDTGLDLAAIDQGMMKSRQDVIRGKMVLLGFDEQDHSLRNHIRVAAMLNYATRVGKVLGSKEVRDAIIERHGVDFARSLQDTVRFSLDGMQSRDGISSTLRWTRINLMSSIYAFNLLSAAKQPFGVLTAMGHKDAGFRATLKASRAVLTNPKDMYQIAYKMSNFMRDRWDSQDLDIAKTEEGIGGPSRYRKIMHVGMQPMRFGQFYADLVTWHAAFSKASEMGKTDAEAAQVADQAVLDTQGSAYRIDQALINRTQVGAVLTFAAKWVINNSNTMIRLAYEVKAGDRDAKKRLLKYTIMSVAIGGASQIAVGAALQVEDDDERQRSFGDYQARILQDYLSSPHWMARGFVPLMYGAFEGDTMQAYRDSLGAVGSISRIIESPAKVAGKISRGEDTTIEEVVGSAVKVGGLVTGLPATQINRVIKAGTADWEDGWERFVIAIFGADRTPIQR